MKVWIVFASHAFLPPWWWLGVVVLVVWVPRLYAYMLPALMTPPPVARMSL